MKLLDFMAKACHYAQEHIEDAFNQDREYREELLQCTSYQIACFLCQNTRLGGDGVEWEVILKELVERPRKREEEWRVILAEKANLLGGMLDEPAPVSENGEPSFCIQEGYMFNDVEDFEKTVGFKVNEAFIEGFRLGRLRWAASMKKTDAAWTVE